MNRPAYNPQGVCKSPISIRLMEHERAEADALADHAGVSRAKILRDAVVAGLPIVRAALFSSSSATPPLAADLSGGEVTQASPAGLSSTDGEA